MARLVHEFVQSAVERFGDRTALVDDNGTLTYRQLWDRSRRVAGALADLGVHPGDRVVGLMNNRNEWVEVDNAVSMLGAVRGRLNNRDSAREFAFVLNDLRPAVVVTGPEFTDTIQGLVDNGSVPAMRVLGLGPDGDYERLLAAAEPMDARPTTVRCTRDLDTRVDTVPPRPHASALPEGPEERPTASHARGRPCAARSA